MNILIVGDSFAADWSVKYKNVSGWPTLLNKIYNVTNLAQAGVSEYKIYKQLISVNLNSFDLVIITHTSPYRVVTRNHPIHFNDELHKHSDLLLSDIEYHCKFFKNWLNRSLQSAYYFFIDHFDQEYQELVYELLVERIETVLHDKPTLTILTPIALGRHVKQTNIMHIHDSQVQQGLTNHMSDSDNHWLFQKICDKINEIEQS